MGGRVHPECSPDLFVTFTSTLKAAEGAGGRVWSPSKESCDGTLPCGTSASCLGGDTAGDSKRARRTGIAERLLLLSGFSPLLQMWSTGSTVDDRGLSPVGRGTITAGEAIEGCISYGGWEGCRQTN